MSDRLKTFIFGVTFAISLLVPLVPVYADVTVRIASFYGVTPDPGSEKYRMDKTDNHDATNCKAVAPNPDKKTITIPQSIIDADPAGWVVWLVSSRDYLIINRYLNNHTVDEAVDHFNRQSFILCPYATLSTDNSKTNTLVGIIYSLLIWIITLFAILLFILLWLAGHILLLLLTYHSFVTSSFIGAAWRDVMAIANLFFIVALLVIALLVTVRRQGTEGFKRLLPALLLGAILINFSLLIGGVVIDASRLATATLTQYIVKVKPGKELTSEEFTTGLLTSSALFNSTFEPRDLFGYKLMLYPKVFTKADWKFNEIGEVELARVLLTTLLIGVLFVGFLVIAVALANRLVKLFLLLAISPGAYLALAFPGGGPG